MVRGVRGGPLGTGSSVWYVVVRWRRGGPLETWWSVGDVAARPSAAVVFSFFFFFSPFFLSKSRLIRVLLCRLSSLRSLF